MREEIEAAVAWWTAQLRGEAVHDTGSAEEDIFMGAMAGIAHLAPLSEEKLAEFAAALRAFLGPYLAESDPDPREPRRGSYLRVIGTDWGPLGGPLNDAVEATHIDGPSLRLPTKTRMWIDPGEVRVAVGYRGPVTVIYPAEGPSS